MKNSSAQNNNVKHHYALFAGGASLVSVVLLIAVKGFAWIHSGSASILASLVDSVSDAAVSLMSFYAIRYSLQPADHEHRHGHGNIEGLAALMQAAFISGAAVFLLLESLSRFADHHPVEGHVTGIVVMVFSIFISIILVGIQRYVLKHAPSLAVEADKAHYSGDIAINLGVIVVLTTLYFGGPDWVDPVFAILVSAYLVWIAKDVGRLGIDMILDRELGEDVRKQIHGLVDGLEGVLGVHDLRTRKSGMRVFISFDIEVDENLSLHDAHEIARRAEDVVLAEFPNAEIMIHVDPHGDPDDSRHHVQGVHI